MDPPFPQEREDEYFASEFGKTIDMRLLFWPGVPGEPPDLQDARTSSIGNCFLANGFNHHCLEVLREVVHRRHILSMQRRR
jgi:hypothetical protein